MDPDIEGGIRKGSDSGGAAGVELITVNSKLGHLIRQICLLLLQEDAEQACPAITQAKCQQSQQSLLKDTPFHRQVTPEHPVLSAEPRVLGHAASSSATPCMLNTSTTVDILSNALYAESTLDYRSTDVNVRP